MLLCFKVCYLWSQLCLTAANNAVVKVSFEIQSSRVFEKSSKGRFRRIISGTLSQNSENYPLKAKFKL